MSEHRIDRLERADGDDPTPVDFTRYRNDPVGFCVTVLGVDSATRRSNGEPYQFQVLTDVVHSPRVAVRSGHGVGKSAIDAWAALWWLVTRPMSRVIVLAPEFARQIRAVLFSEARKWAQRARVKLPVDVLASRILVNGYGEEWSATGASTSGDVARLEGFHAEGGVLLVMDEMKGITTEAFDAVMGALTNAENSRLLVTSVAGGAGGPFYNVCARDSARWTIHHIPSTDSSLVSPQWVEDRRIEWGGTETALYQMRVLGNFADLEAGAMVAISTLELMDTLHAAQPTISNQRETEEPGVGIDPAFTGDLCAITIAAKRGDMYVVKETFVLPRTPDPDVLVARIVEELASRGIVPREQQVHSSRLNVYGTPAYPHGRDAWGEAPNYEWVGGWGALAVDQAGSGRGPAWALKHRLHFNTMLYDSGHGAADSRRYPRCRPEAYGLASDLMLRGKVAMAFNEHMSEEMLATRMVVDLDGRQNVEPKAAIKKKLGRSPDRLDSLVMALYALMRPGRMPKNLTPVRW